MNITCKHDWELEPRNNRRELWEVCQICGAERQLRIVHIEPLKDSSKNTKKKKMGTSTISRRVDELFEDTD